MESHTTGTMKVAALGRPFCPGMLYDGRKDELVPGITLWDHEDLIKHISKRPQRSNDFEIVASESIEDKCSALNVEASLKASFLSGLVDVDGSAKYLNDSKTSRNQARVTLSYKATTEVQQLSMNHLGRGNVNHPDVFDKDLATHVVTAVLYGAQAFFVFDRELSKDENHQNVQGNLEVMIKQIPCLSLEGHDSLKMEDEGKTNVNKFSCRFFGDFSLHKPPTSFQEAVDVYQSLPKLLGANGENAVPVKVWLLPLTSLDSKATKLVRQISIGLVQEAQSVLEDFNELDMRCNDALKTTAQQFPQISKKMKRFKGMCSEFKMEFQQSLAKKLPSIRVGGEEESVLAEILKKRHSSPFSSKHLSEWMDCKEREICTLKSFTNMMKNAKIVPSQRLHEETLSAEHVVCFVFTSLEGSEPYLLTYLKRTNPDEPQDPSADVKDQWFTSKEIMGEMRHKAKLFRDFAEANKEKQNVKFLILGLTNESHKGSSIYLYKDGFSVSDNFEPPSKPEAVTVGDIAHNSVTLKVSPPRFGAEGVTSYSVEYCVSGDDGWRREPASQPGDVTVGGLRPNTEYVFRCRAETSAGVGPHAEAAGPIRTLPCSPPGNPRLEPNSSEISVSWEKPAELGADVHVLSYTVEFARTENGLKEEDLHWKQVVSGAGRSVISGLQSETDYVVRVRCDCGVDGSSKESSSVGVRTTSNKVNLSDAVKKTRTLLEPRTGSLPVYKVPLTEEPISGCRRVSSSHLRTAAMMSNWFGGSGRLSDVVRRDSRLLKNDEEPLKVYAVKLTKKEINVDGCRRFSFGKESNKTNRTIMVLGATGAGKSTLINGMINYILGVEWGDEYRFKLVDGGQTSEVTVYKLNYREGFQVKYSLTIIDTPGFGDTRGIDRDRTIVEQLRNLFSAEHGVSEIDAVCFVAQASLARLTPTQKYVFDSVLSIFGKDVAENIRVLVTFCDGQRPPVLEAIKTAEVPCPKTKDGLPVHFKFNNSVLFAANNDDDEDENFDKMFWNMGTKSMKRFFDALNVMETKSLTMTKEVLRERKQLENSVENLQMQVKVGLAKLEEIKETSEKLEEHEAEFRRNENFEFEFSVKKPIQVDISRSGRYITNCQQCHHTCHDDCGIANDRKKYKCRAMGPNGHCTVCPGKCYWNVHFNQKYRWDYKEVREKRTVKELKEKYLQATEGKFTVEAVVSKLKAEYDDVQATVVKLMEESGRCLNRLKEIALKPNPLSTPEYIDMLIDEEKSEAKPGWKQRVQSLTAMREKAEYMAKVEKGEKVLRRQDSQF